MWLKIIALLCLLSICCQPSWAKCSCSSGGFASYNFLSDPSFDIDMESPDEFIRASTTSETSGTSTAEVQRQRNLPSSLFLDLNDGRHIELALFQAEDDLYGRGNITTVQEAQQAGASISRSMNDLNINLVSVAGALYRFNLTADGSRLEGNYTEILPDQKIMQGTVQGSLR